jgi:peptidoglycan/LPS O-acetylase OafA/YrhL
MNSKSLGTLFLATGVIFALMGMAWGIQMSVTQDHTLAPAHGHLNLIGFVAMAIFGIYYTLTPQAAQGWLGKIHYMLAVTAVVILVPGIKFAIADGEEGLAKAGSLLAVAMMALFLVIVLRNGIGSKDR